MNQLFKLMNQLIYEILNNEISTKKGRKLKNQLICQKLIVLSPLAGREQILAIRKISGSLKKCLSFL